MYTQVWCGVKAENLLSKFFQIPKKIWRKNLKFTSNFRGLPSVGTRNFEMAHLLNKRITDFLSTINVPQNGTKPGAIIARGFDAT